MAPQHVPADEEQALVPYAQFTKTFDTGVAFVMVGKTGLSFSIKLVMSTTCRFRSLRLLER